MRLISPTYKVGYEGYSRHRGRKFEEVEADLQRDYERAAGRTGLAWDKARNATRDAWRKLDQPSTTSPSQTMNTPQSGTGTATGTTGKTGTGCGCG